jgi:hypothetical protein
MSIKYDFKFVHTLNGKIVTAAEVGKCLSELSKNQKPA